MRYIPKLKRNLISTGTLDMLGFKHSGGKGKTRFYKNGMLALQDTLTGSLYLFDGKTVAGQVNISVQKIMSLSRDETSIWHKRLGHLSIKNLQILAKRGILDIERIGFLAFCENCVMGKHKKLSFHAGRHDSGEALKYIYADLWGFTNVTPSLSPSLFRKQYFMSIIDDFTRKVWVFFLVN